MGNYEQLKQAVADVIKTNGNKEITGAILQNSLLTIISTVGANATFAGIATPETNPGTPDQNVFYIATKSGVYSNFNGEKILNECAIFTNKANSWQKIDLNIASIESFNSLNEQIAVLGTNSLIIGDEISYGTTRGYIDSNGTFQLTPNALLSDFIETETAKAFLYTGLMNGTNPNVIGYDSDKNYMGSIIVGKGKKRTLYPVLLDDSIKYIRIQSHLQMTLSLYNVAKNNDIINNLYELNNLLGNKIAIRDYFLPIGTTTNGYIDLNGNYIENANSVLSDFIDVSDINMLIYTGIMNGTNPNVTWFYSDKKFGGVLLSGIGNINSVYFNIPHNAKYIRVQSISALSLQYVSNISDIINDIEKHLYIKDCNVLNSTSFEKYFIDSKGIISASLNCNLSDFISVKYGDRYFLTSRISGANPMVWGYDELKQPINILVYGDNGQKRIDYLFSIPKNVKFIRVQSIIENPLLFNGTKIKDNVNDINESVYYIGNNILNEVSFTNQWVDSEGNVSPNENAYLSDYIEITENEYYATGQMSSSNPIVVSYDSEKTFIGVSLRTDNGKKLIDEKFQINNTDVKYIRIQSKNEKPLLKRQVNINDKIDELSNNNFVIDYVAPQIYQLPQKKKNISDGVRIMGFGSSFFMNTWWYVPYLLQTAGIKADLSFFYDGGASFDQWIARFENNSSVDCWASTNGSYFTTTTKKFRDCIEEGWDIIGFQQGAFQSRDWTTFSNWSKLVSYIRRSCNYDTFIGFNCLWPPAIQGDLSPYPSTAEGQKLWQLEANENFKKFLALSGLNCGAVPNGATIWALRKNPLTKDEVEDLAHGGLHINNGLPMYATAATWFETIVSPMFGITIDNIDWIPTGKTPKCPVSPNYTPISTEQRDLIRKIIKLSASNRFGLNEL